MTVLARCLSALRRGFLRRRGCRIAAGGALAAGVRMRRGVRNGRPGEIALESGCEICEGAILDAWGGGIRLGRAVFVGPYAVIYGHGGVSVGAGTLISMHCRILSSDHSIPPAGRRIRDEPDILKPTRIGAVWLGAGVTVLGGVSIGDGAVVGAGTVVKRDIPAAAVVAGNPPRVLRSR